MSASVLKDAPTLALIVCRKMIVLLRAQGIWGTVVFCAQALAQLPRRVSSLSAEAAYDRKMGVETSRLVHIKNLGIDPAKLEATSQNASGVAYMPSPAGIPGTVLKELGLRYEEYTFIDLGSGMGRVVLEAAEFPFRKVVGVEFSHELHGIAERNLSKTSDRLRASIELICQDAQEYTLPLGNCIIYLFNPFRETVMQTVLKKLETSYRTTGAELYVIYYNPVLVALLDAAPFLTKIKAGGEYSVYRSTPQEARLAAT